LAGIYPGRASKGMAYVPLSRLSQVPEQLKNPPSKKVDLKELL